MKLTKIKLNNLAENSLANREMKDLKGGVTCCTCSCYYQGSGGSSSTDNSAANSKIGEYGGYSPYGDNQYVYCG